MTTKITVEHPSEQGTIKFEYEVIKTYAMSGSKFDDLVRAVFPNLKWPGFAVGMECDNDTDHLFTDVGNDKWIMSHTRKLIDAIKRGESCSGERFPSHPTFDIDAVLYALVEMEVIPAGDWLIRVSW